MRRATMLLFAMSFAAAAAEPPPALPPEVAAFAAAQPRIRTLVARIEVEMALDGGTFKGRILYERPRRLRIEVGGRVIVSRGARTDADPNAPDLLGAAPWLVPVEEGVHPLTLLFTFLEPDALEADELQTIWYPGTESLGVELVDGQRLVHLRRERGAWVFDWWYAPHDGVMRRFRITDAGGAVIGAGRLAVEQVNQPLAADLFRLRFADRVDPVEAPEAPPGWTGSPGSPEAEARAWRALTRLGPQSSAAELLRAAQAVRTFCESGGVLPFGLYQEHVLAAILACQAARRTPTAAHYRAAIEACIASTGASSAMALFRESLERHAIRWTQDAEILDHLVGALNPELLVSDFLPLLRRYPDRVAPGPVMIVRCAGVAPAEFAFDQLLRYFPNDLPPNQVAQRLQALHEWEGMLFARVASRLPEARQPAFRELLRRLEPHWPDVGVAERVAAYLAARDVEGALRSLDAFDPTTCDQGHVIHLARSLCDAGRRAEAERLLRATLARHVTDDWVDYAPVVQLLRDRVAREVLAPVVRQLAELDRLMLKIGRAHV